MLARLIVLGGAPREKVIVSAPLPWTQFESMGVVSVFADSIAWRRLHWLEVPAGSSVVLTTIGAALALAARLNEATAPTRSARPSTDFPLRRFISLDTLP